MKGITNASNKNNKEYFIKTIIQISLALFLLSLSQGCTTYKSFGKPSHTIINQIINYEDGSVYKGSTHKDIPYGAGILHYKDGSVYNGEFKNGLLHGIGHMEYTDGSMYCGEFKNGQSDGKGYFSKGKNRVKYIGDFKNGKQDGNGELLFSDGSLQVGEIKENKMHGIGIFHRIDGQNFPGIFVDNKCVADQESKEQQK